MQFPLATLMVMDQHLNGIPAVWALTGAKGEREDYMVRRMSKLKQLMGPEWRPSCFMVDDCNAEINAIRYTALQPLPKGPLLLVHHSPSYFHS